MNGDKLPMFIIGKSQKPRCFKNIKKIPCRYRGQKRSWMDSTLLEEWVREFDSHFEKENRKVALIVDNCTAHPEFGGSNQPFLSSSEHDICLTANGSRGHPLRKSEIQNESCPKND